MGGKSATVTEMPRRRSYVDAGDADGFDPEGEFRPGVRPGVRLSFSSGVVPKTVWGRVAAGCGLALVMGAGVVGMLAARSFILHDEHFTVPGSSSIEIAGYSHLTRPQLLSVFGEDVERNVFNIPLAERRAELERLPWVAHATVMRLLPNRVRVSIVERTPVAFVRQGKEIGLVDASGVLLDMSGQADAAASGGLMEEDGDAAKLATYSFPVLTGILGGDPVSVRAARMKIYMTFVAALDATGEKISHRLSEVDLSNPEDVKAILSSGGAEAGAAGTGAEILVHFGDGKFLERYRRYEQHLAEWRTQYPKLASVDMRYERQVVLEMQAGPAGTNGKAANSLGDAAGPAKAKPAAAKAKPVQSAAATKIKPVVAAAAAKPAAVASSSSAASGVTKLAPGQHLTTAFSVLPVPATKAKAAGVAGIGLQGGPQ